MTFFITYETEEQSNQILVSSTNSKFHFVFLSYNHELTVL